MKNIVNLLVLLFSTILFGQISIINDSDGYVNVRKSPDSKSEIVHKIYDNDLFWVDTDGNYNDSEWLEVYIPKNKFSLGNYHDDYLNGYIHESRILYLDDLKKHKEDFKFEYIITEFNIDKRIIDYEQGKLVKSIDGRHPWGTDGNIPKTQIDQLIIKVDGIKIKVNDILINDLFECKNHFKVYKTENYYFVKQWNSDGAGAYQIIWVINKTGVVQRFVHSMI